ncbi:MAG: hypothetical protein AAFY71_15845 [Bacteroidota bacterium]
MKLSSKQKLVFILAFSLLGLRAWSQSLQESFELAAHYVQISQFELAAETYERILFFDQNNTYRSRCFDQLAGCYIALGEWEKALTQLNFAYYQQTTQKGRNQIQFRLIVTYLLSGKPQSAKEEILILEDDLSEEETDRFHYYAGITYFSLEDFANSKAHFEAYLGEESTPLRDELDNIFLRNEKVSRINPKRARRMSQFLPGLGQAYAGNAKDAINSLLLTGGLLTLTVYVGINVSIFDAILAVWPWFYRYYQGGYKRSELMAFNKKERKRAEIYQELLQLLARR